MTNIAEKTAVWRQCLAETAAAKNALITEIFAELENGSSEYKVATQVGVTRLTIRAWIGK